MAEQRQVECVTAPGNDYSEHEAMYQRFVWLTKWGVIAAVMTLVLMAIFLT